MRWWLVVLAWLLSPAVFAAANSLEIESVNASVNVTAGANQPVDADRTITLSLKTGTGNLTGTLTGVILNATDTVTISGVLYNRAETGVVITATVTTGGALDPDDSSPFTVIPGMATLALTAL